MTWLELKDEMEKAGVVDTDVLCNFESSLSTNAANVRIERLPQPDGTVIVLVTDEFWKDYPDD